MSFIGLRRPPRQTVGPELQVGDSAPYMDAMLPDKAQYLVAFIRHVGCPFAEKTVRELRHLADDFPELQCIVVSHGDPQTTRRWLQAIGGAEGLTLVIDESRTHYGAFGVGYSGAAHFLGPGTLIGVLGLLGKGIRNRIASGTRWQKSATFLLDASRTVLWCHNPSNAADVPSLRPVLERHAGDLAAAGLPPGSEAPSALRVRILEHAPYEGIGSIEHWLAWRNARVDITRFHAPGWELPAPADVDLVIAMGGPMSVNDETAYPWLAAEKTFLREAVERGVAVVGICLGAQLIASALGARVGIAEQPEIGWFDIHATPVTTGCFRFPSRVPVLHWHSETCDLPPGAILLADSPACENQAFQIGARVLGLQFHLEATPGSLEAMLAHEGEELGEGPCIQTERELREVADSRYRHCAKLMSAVLSYVTRRSASGSANADLDQTVHPAIGSG